MIVVEQKKQKADYEREEYQNDVRYQNRTEITLDYVVAKRSQGLFRFFMTFAAKVLLIFLPVYSPADRILIAPIRNMREFHKKRRIAADGCAPIAVQLIFNNAKR